MKYVALFIFGIIVLILNCIGNFLWYLAYIFWSFKILSFKEFLIERIDWFDGSCYDQESLRNENIFQTLKRWFVFDYF